MYSNESSVLKNSPNINLRIFDSRNLYLILGDSDLIKRIQLTFGTLIRITTRLQFEIRSQTLLTSILRSRVGAVSGSGPLSILAGIRAFGPSCPFCPRSIDGSIQTNCRSRLTGFLVERVSDTV